MLRPPDDRNIYSVQPFKRALVERYGPAEAFERFRDAIDWYAGDRIAERRLAGLYETAMQAGRPLVEVYAGGEPFVVDPPRCIGPNDARPMRGISRSFYVACLDEVRLRAKSGLLLRGDAGILDFERAELQRVRARFDVDPGVFCAGDASVWGVETAGGETLKFDEAFVSLLGPNTASFGHWMWEYLPKYATAVASGALPAVPVLVDPGMPATHLEALESLMPAGGKIVALPPFARARIARAWCAPSLAFMPPLVATDDAAFSPYDHPCAPTGRYAATLEAMKAASDALASQPEGPSKVYLARPEGTWRKLLDRADVESIARSKGFTIVNPERMSFLQQASTIRNARFVLGPEGSAMYLNFFARPGTRVCILNHPFVGDVSAYTGILRDAGIDVTVFCGPAVNLNDAAGYPLFGYSHFADYEIGGERLAPFLDRWLDGAAV